MFASDTSQNSSVVDNGGSAVNSGDITEPENASAVSMSGVGLITDTTVFVDDANVVRRDLSMIAHVDDTILSINDSQFIEQTLINFLEKPIILTRGVFSTTDTYSFLNSYSMPYAALQTTNGLVWRQKLAGYFGIRMDMVFKLVSNANRFQQGRYAIGWVPMAGPVRTTSDLKNIAYNNMHMATLVQRTTVPHVELDLATATSCELTVPFISVRNYFPLNSVNASIDYHTLGYMNIYPYSPLVSPAGSTTAGYTLYVSFSNIKLFGAASPQGLSSKKGKSKIGLADKEVANTSNGPISSVATAISRGFNEFSNIPLIGSYAKDVSWIADRIASVSSIFGFSKPTQGDCLTKVALYQAASHNNIDGDSDVKAMSYLQKPGVVNIDGLSGTQYDEMDFSYIVRKHAWFKTVSWSLSTVVGNLTTIDVGPSVGYYVATNCTHYTPFGFVSKFFRFWRGSIKYRFKIVKTEFHSGRLQISFFPTDQSAYTTSPEYVNRLIVDIRETSEFEITVPFISINPWAAQSDRIGILSIDVTDVLVAPATVSSSITILCETAAGQDMEFAIPADFSANPALFVPQSGLTSEDRIVNMTIGNSTITSNPHIASSLCIGDKVSSFRAYLKRYHPLRPLNKTITSTFLPNNNVVGIVPDAIFCVPITIVGTSYTIGDPITTIGSCYAIWRGGVRVRDVIETGMSLATSDVNTCIGKVAVGDTVNYSFPYFNVTDTTPEFSNAHIAFQDLTRNPVMSVELPQYTQTYGRSTVDCTAVQDAASFTYNGSVTSSTSRTLVKFCVPSSQFSVVTAVAGHTVHNLHRALADDGDFSCFVSVPPMFSNVFEAGGVTGMY
jgi:hypothetical protein